jgi:hypothetical protein
MPETDASPCRLPSYAADAAREWEREREEGGNACPR